MSGRRACELCHCADGVAVRRGFLLCDECVDQADYWDNLTPEQRAAEDCAMAMYVDESSETG